MASTIPPPTIPANGNFATNYSGSMPGGATNMFFYYPGEQLGGAIGSQVAQTGAGLTLTTTGISAAAVSGTTYTASIYYANLTTNGNNNGPNVTLNILAGGVVVGTGTVTGLAPGSPWTQVTATWTASSHIGASDSTPGSRKQLPGGNAGVADTYFWFDPRHLDGHGQRAQSPTVTNVAVSGAGWASPVLDPRRHRRQLLPLPWSGINQIQVTFNENVTVDQSDLLLTGVNVPSYNVAGGTFSYDSTTFTATWTLPQSIGADQLMLALNANGSDPIRRRRRQSLGRRMDESDQHHAVPVRAVILPAMARPAATSTSASMCFPAMPTRTAR